MFGFCDTEAAARILFILVTMGWELRLADCYELLPIYFVSEKQDGR